MKYSQWHFWCRRQVVLSGYRLETETSSACGQKNSKRRGGCVECIKNVYIFLNFNLHKNDILEPLMWTAAKRVESVYLSAMRMRSLFNVSISRKILLRNFFCVTSLPSLVCTHESINCQREFLNKSWKPREQPQFLESSPHITRQKNKSSICI
jgi:hypothetical protein